MTKEYKDARHSCFFSWLYGFQCNSFSIGKRTKITHSHKDRLANTIREALENSSHPRENTRVIAGTD
jgi:hypothetical protein